MNTASRPWRAVRRGALGVALAAAFVLLLGFSAPASADNVSQIANGLADTRLYVTTQAQAEGSVRTSSVEKQLNDAADADLRAVVVDNDSTKTEMLSMLRSVANRVGEGQTYVAITADGSKMTGISQMFSGDEINELIAKAAPSSDVSTRLATFADVAEPAADDEKRASMISGFVTLGVVVALLGTVMGAFLVAGKRRRDREAQQMAELKKGVEEDVTLLGEDIAELDLNVLDPSLDADTRSDYERAMNSYDDAKRATDRATKPYDMEAVTEALESGRYHMVATRARLAGEPVPERRAPCFFNPQHGPSVKDVTWAPPGGVARSVPACAKDAQRVLKGQEPDVRLVPSGDRRLPYYNAGPAYAPYAGGYYAGYGGLDLLSGMMIGTMLGSMMMGGMGGYGDMGGGLGGDTGDMGGGWDFGSGDFGGGLGGGDFGGF